MDPGSAREEGAAAGAQVVLRRGLDGERSLKPVAEGGGHVALPDWPRVLLVYSKLLRLGIMPVSRFLHSRTYCMQRLDRARATPLLACMLAPLRPHVPTLRPKVPILNMVSSSFLSLRTPPRYRYEIIG